MENIQARLLHHVRALHRAIWQPHRCHRLWAAHSFFAIFMVGHWASTVHRTGEGSKTAKSIPPRSEPIDKDEDTLEMLSNASAHISTNKLKKAKLMRPEKQRNATNRLLQIPELHEVKVSVLFPWKTFAKTATHVYCEMREVSVGWRTQKRKFWAVVDDLQVNRMCDGNNVHVYRSAWIFLAVSLIMKRRYAKWTTKSRFEHC